MSRPAVFGSLIPAVTIMNAGIGMLLPQIMAPHVFGEYALVVTLFNYGLIFDLGISQLIDRWIPMHVEAGNLAKAHEVGDKLLWLRLGIAVATFVLTGSILLLLQSRGMLPFGIGAALCATVAGLADMVALGPVCIDRARSRRRNYAIMITALLSGLVVARMGGLVVGGLLGCFAAMAAWYLGFAVLFGRRAPLKAASRPTGREALSLIGYGLPFFATSFIWAFYVTCNRWIGSFLLAGQDFGQFAFSANLFSLLVGSIGGFSAFYYPKIAGRIANGGEFAQSGRLTRDLARLIVATSLLVAVGSGFAGILIRTIYPSYILSVGSARVILVAVTPMVVASWLMPVSQSAARRPWVDGAFIFPLATALLAVAIVLFNRSFGVVGIAAASTASALPLVATQLIALNSSKILRPRDALVLFGATVVSCVALGALAWATD